MGYILGRSCTVWLLEDLAFLCFWAGKRVIDVYTYMFLSTLSTLRARQGNEKGFARAFAFAFSRHRLFWVMMGMG
jgi:hypothetical protein